MFDYNRVDRKLFDEKKKIKIDDPFPKQNVIYFTEYDWIAQIIFDCVTITGLVFLFVFLSLAAVYMSYLGILIEFIPDPLTVITGIFFSGKQSASTVSQCQALVVNVCSQSVTAVTIRKI